MNTVLQDRKNTYFESAVTRAAIVADTQGICNLAAIPGAAISEIEESNQSMFGDDFCGSELSRNIEFAKNMFDLTMNCLDINEDVANRHIRIAQVDRMIVALNKLKEKL